MLSYPPRPSRCNQRRNVAAWLSASAVWSERRPWLGDVKPGPMLLLRSDRYNRI